MSVVINIAKERLKRGGLAVGLGLRQARTADIGLIARASGFDWIFIDCEHNAMDLSTACEIATAALGQGVTPIVRVAGKEHHHGTRVLDNGAMGVVVPHVDTAEEARQIVSNFRYPPVGHRSISRASPMVGFEPVPIGDFCRGINEQVLVVVMLESPEAIDSAEAIAAVEGIDVLLIGTNDLTAEMGIPGEFGHERVADAYGRTVEACRKHGKYAGMAGVPDPELQKRYIDIGARFILADQDLRLMVSAGRSCTGYLRGLNDR
ncbi:MAG: aldolase/citrate lyase family protein [Acetobacterales bacterium]